MGDTAQELKDKWEIVDVVNRYTTALDSRDWDMLANTFTPDGSADFEGLAGVGTLETPQAVVDLCSGALQNLTATQHLQGNYVVELNGDTATAVCNLQANHFADGRPGGTNFVVWATDRDELVGTAQGLPNKAPPLVPISTGGNQNLFNEAAEL